MSSNNTDMTQGPLVLVTQQNGVTVIPQPTPLTRLNYFDGKFLRASDLSAEQLYLRRLVDLSNQAGGPGVAHGYDLSLAAGGDTLNLGPGLAIDPQGRVLLLPEAFSVGVQDLIDKSRQLQSSTAAASGNNGQFGDCTVVVETPPAGVVQVGNLYLISIGFAEALCGTEDVFGNLCEEACATSTDRPYLVEGVVLRAIPLQLQTPLPTSAVVALSQLHLRSRVASSYFEDERNKVAGFISGDGLRSNVWCFGAEAAGGLDVPLGVLARAGSTTLFLDAWIARRERIDTPAKRYWQWRMAMRPWDVFLAQILQFQCQLSDLFKKQPPAGGGDDPCASAYGVIREASDTVAKIASFYQTVTTRFTLQPLLVSGNAGAEQPPALDLVSLLDFQKRLQAISAATSIPSDKILIDGGIIELSSAGYLPVTPNSVVSVNEQVRRLLGKGVDLRFCIVRPDFVAHALEEAQHMERISLLEGLDHPDRKPEVDILVPNGEAIEQKPVAGVAYEAEFRVGDSPSTDATGTVLAGADNRPVLRGAAHIEVPESGQVRLFNAVELDESQQVAGLQTVRRNFTIGSFFTTRPSDTSFTAVAKPGQQNALSFWAAVTCSLNPLTVQSGGQALLEIRLVVAIGGSVSDFLMSGTLTFDDPVVAGAKRVVKGTFSGTLSIVSQDGNQGQENNSRLSLEVTAILSTPDGQAPSLQLTLINRKAQLEIEILASWSDNPRKIALGLKQTDPMGGTRTIFDSTFTQNDDVLLPTNNLHVTALGALDTIGAALADQQFPPKSAALLFPPPPPPAADLQIRAVLDWVLFHRRRTKQCQPEPTVVVIPARQYQLWHGLVANTDFLEKTIKALHSAAAFDPDGVAFQRVAVVEFAPGIQTLISSLNELLNQWKGVKPGPTLFYGAIASRDAAKQDGPDLAKARLGEVEQAVASISAPAVPAPPAEVLDDIHPDLAVPDVDGIIVLITQIQKTCQTVFRIPIPAADIVGLINQGGIADVVKRSTKLGVVSFTAGTDQPDNSIDAVVAAWNTLGGGQPAEAVVVTRAGDNTTLPVAIATAQARAIQRTIGQGALLPLPQAVQSSVDLPVDCPAITFLRPSD